VAKNISGLTNDLNLYNYGNLEPPHLDIVTSLSFMGKYLVTCSKDKIIKLWDTKIHARSDLQYKNKKIGLVGQIDNPHQLDHISFLLGNNDFGTSFLSASNEGIIKNWEFKENRLICRDSLPITQETIESVSWADESDMSFLVSSGDRKIRLYNKEVDCADRHL
jgi:WD40 repeat protein